ncbi:hypothetical protein GF389_06210 [Candidatus Dojkabacteria bacterium]|nr:hypothetical protein [Candidatus Dojkabacteria bacterium]
MRDLVRKYKQQIISVVIFASIQILFGVVQLPVAKIIGNEGCRSGGYSCLEVGFGFPLISHYSTWGWNNHAYYMLGYRFNVISIIINALVYYLLLRLVRKIKPYQSRLARIIIIVSIITILMISILAWIFHIAIFKMSCVGQSSSCNG